MQQHQLDFTDTFIELESIRFNGLKAPESLSAWLPGWFEALDRKNDTDALATMRKANPALIARNHQIEFAIQEACVNEDFTRFDQLRAAVTDPFNRAHTGTPLSEARSQGKRCCAPSVVLRSRQRAPDQDLPQYRRYAQYRYTSESYRESPPPPPAPLGKLPVSGRRRMARQ